MKRKYPSELNTRHVRVSLGDYALLVEVSRKVGVTMAEALHLVIEHREHQEREIRVPSAQIPLAVYEVRAQSAIVVNGTRQGSAFIVKPKGGVICE